MSAERSIDDYRSEIELINELLQSNKDVLPTLSIQPAALLTGLVIPRLENLQTLSLHLDIHNSITDLSRLADTFPNVEMLGKKIEDNS